MGQPEKLYLAIFVIFVTVPILYAVIARNPRIELLVLIAALFFASFSTALGISFFSHEGFYRGTVWGYTLQLSDLLFLVLLIKSIVSKPPLEAQVMTGLYVIYLLVITVSILLSPHSNEPYAYYGLFEAAKFLIVFYYFMTGFTEQKLDALFVALVMISAFHGTSFLWDRYILGAYRVSGFLFHPNLMGSFVLLLSMPLLLVLASPGVKAGVFKIVTVSATALICTGVILSVSRSTLVVFLFGILLILGYSFSLHAKKALGWLLIIALISIPVAYKSSDTIMERFTISGTTGGGRDEMNSLAIRMVLDYPAGVGINNYSRAAREYQTEDFQANYLHYDVPPAHNAYLLVLAETGFAGLLVFILLLLMPMLYSLRASRLLDDSDWRKHFIVGMNLAVFLLLLQAFLEDSLRRGVMMSLLFPYLGLMAAVPAMVRRLVGGESD